MVARVGAVALLLLLAGCTEPCAEGSMLESDGGLVVTRAEHPTAWGRTDCATCHALGALHRRGCAAVDLEAVRAEVDAEGLASCASCHGALGVTP